MGLLGFARHSVRCQYSFAHARDSDSLLFLLAIIALNVITEVNSSRRTGDDFFFQGEILQHGCYHRSELEPA